jgi:hypothetical protein
LTRWLNEILCLFRDHLMAGEIEINSEGHAVVFATY